MEAELALPVVLYLCCLLALASAPLYVRGRWNLMAALVLAGTEWGLIRLLWYLTPPQLPGKMQEYYGGLVHGYWLEVPERAVLAGAVLAILWSVVAAFRR